MAKKTNNELLSDILTTLDVILNDQEKHRKKVEKGSPKKDGILSKIFGTETEIKSETKNTIGIVNSLKLLVETVKTSKSIKNADIDHLKYIVSSLSSVFKDIKFNNTDAESFNKFADGLKKLNDAIAPLNQNLIKTIWKYNGLRGWFLGKRLAKFYVNFFKAFENAKLFTFLEKDGNINKLVNFTEALVKMLNVNGRNLRRSVKAYKKFNEKAVNNLIYFFKSLIEFINGNDKGDWKGVPATKPFENKLKSFEKLLHTLSLISLKMVISLVLMSKLVNKEGGEKIGGFFKGIIDGINEIKEKQVDSASHLIKSIAILIGALTLTLVVLILVAKSFEREDILLGSAMLIGVVLLAIGIIKVLSWMMKDKKAAESTKDGIKMAGVIAILLLTLTICLTILVNIAKKNDLADIGLGVLMLGIIVVLAVGMITVLAKQLEGKKAAETKDGIIMAGVIAILLIALTISIAIVIKIAKDNKIEDIITGGLIFIAVIGIGMGLIYVMSTMSKAKLKRGMLGAAFIAAAITATSIAVGAYMLLMKMIAGISGEDIAKGSGIVLAILVGFGAIIYFLATFVVGPQALLYAAGTGVLVTLSGSMLLLSGTIAVFLDLLKKINEIDPAIIEDGQERIIGENGIVNCFTNIINGLDKVSGIAAIKAAVIAEAMRPLIKTISKFLDIIEKMANMKFVDHYDEKGNPVYVSYKDSVFEDASITLVTGFSTFITGISALAGENEQGADILSSVQLVCEALAPRRSIFDNMFGNGKASINDLLKVLRNFIDTIEKMANLKFIDSYDEKGNPVYVSYNNGVFGKASETLTNGFSTFIKGLSDCWGENGKDIENVQKLCDAIIPPVDYSTNTQHTSIGQIITVLSTFVDVIDKMANLKFVDKYDEKGNPVYKTFDSVNGKTSAEGVFSLAANNIANAFSDFLTTLHSKLNETSGQIESLIDDLGDGDTVDLFKALGDFSKAIEIYGGLQVPDKWDENGRPTHYHKVQAGKAAESLAANFAQFIIILNNRLTGIKKSVASVIETLSGDGGIVKVFDAVNKFMEPVMMVAMGKMKDSKGNEIQVDRKIMSHAGYTLASMITGFIKNLKIDNSTKFKEDSERVSDGMKKYTDVINDLLKIDYSKFDSDMKLFDSSSKLLANAMKNIASISGNTNTIQYLNNLSNSIKAFSNSLNNHYTIRVKTKIDKIDVNQEDQYIKIISRKTNAFKNLEISIKKSADQMARLVKLEKEWDTLSNHTVLGRLTETLKKQAETLKEAVDNFTNEATKREAIAVTLNPDEIAQGVQAASFTLKKQGSDTYTKI